MRRILYLGYYLIRTDWELFWKFFKYVRQNKKVGSFSLVMDILLSSVRHNCSLLDYFYFRFYEISEVEKSTYAGAGYMYEFQKKMNPPESRSILHDKRIFLVRYAPFIKHNHVTLSQLEKDSSLASYILSNPAKRVVLKDAEGQCGRGIKVSSVHGLNGEILLDQLRKSGNNLVEEYIVQHSDLQRLAPNGLNTVRIVTQLLAKGEVEIVTARLRMTVDANVDNLAAGNIAAPIDVVSGKVCGPGVFSDITKSTESRHPRSGVAIVGFQVPYWKQTLEMTREAARSHRDNRSIGWDIAITDIGPELLEGNHDWCKLLWQLPVGQGLKKDIEKYNGTVT